MLNYFVEKTEDNNGLRVYNKKKVHNDNDVKGRNK